MLYYAIVILPNGLGAKFSKLYPTATAACGFVNQYIDKDLFFRGYVVDMFNVKTIVWFNGDGCAEFEEFPRNEWESFDTALYYGEGVDIEVDSYDFPMVYCDIVGDEFLGFWDIGTMQYTAIEEDDPFVSPYAPEDDLDYDIAIHPWDYA